jgi:hypothetical protein
VVNKMVQDLIYDDPDQIYFRLFNYG